MRSLVLVCGLLLASPAVAQDCVSGQCARKVATVAKAHVAVAQSTIRKVRSVGSHKPVRSFVRRLCCR